MRKGEIWLVDFEPILGTEANKTRPAVIVSNDGANAKAAQLGRGVVTVVPITSSAARVLSFQVALGTEGTGLGMPSKAQAEQVRSMDATRLIRRLGRCSGTELAQIERALQLHLGL